MDKLLAQVGTINPPPGVVTTGNNPSEFVAGMVRGGIYFLLIIGFVAALLWTIFAGYRFIFAGGDQKSVASATQSIYMGILGLVIVVGAFAIIKLVEIFFKVNIISGGFQLPTRNLP